MFEVPGWDSNASAVNVNFSKSEKKKKLNSKKEKTPKKKNVEGIVKAKHKVQNGEKSLHNNKKGKHKREKHNKGNNNKYQNGPKVFQSKPKSRKENNNLKAQERINLRNQKNNTPQNEFTKFKKRREKKQERCETNAPQEGGKTKVDNKQYKNNSITNELEKTNRFIEEKPPSTISSENVDEQNEIAINNSNIRNNGNKKKRLQRMLEMGRTPNINTTSSSDKLRARMLERLKAAQFRYLNEKLYTSDGLEAQQMFQSDPNSFHTYHAGYQQQLKKWPVNPLDVIANKIMEMPTTTKIADMGCGEGALSKQIPHSVRSFDLISTDASVESCDMAHTPLLAQSMDVVVYCLALMGTSLTQYLLEANRVLKNGGTVMIAEVESRFDNVDRFTKDVERLGFKLTNLDNSHKVFYFFELKKVNGAPNKKSKLPNITLKPCLYKRR